MRISDWSSDVCSSDLSRNISIISMRSSGENAFLISRVKPNTSTDCSTFSSAASSSAPTSVALRPKRLSTIDRKSVVEGKGVSVRVDLGGRRIINKKNINNHNNSITTQDSQHKI